MDRTELTTLSELAKKRNCLKSQLLYYNSLGMLSPISKTGKTMLFDIGNVNKRLDAIAEYRKKGLSLKEIKNKILPTI